MANAIILNFHGIGEPHEGVEPSERPFWMSETQFRDLVDRVCDRPDSRRFLWTFDDGNKSDLTIAADHLAARGRTGSFFALTGRFDDARYLSRGDVRQLADAGMTVGLHGRDHVDWRLLDGKGLAVETIDARRELEDATGRSVEEVAIPFGAYNRRIIAHLKRQNFARIHTSDGGRADLDLRIWSRTSIRGDMSTAALNEILAGHMRAPQRLRRYISRTLRRYVV